MQKKKKKLAEYAKIAGYAKAPGYVKIAVYAKIPGYTKVAGYTKIAGYAKIPGYGKKRQHVVSMAMIKHTTYEMFIFLVEHCSRVFAPS